MRLVEVKDFTFNRVVLTWHGPYPWPKATGAFKLDNAIMDDPGLYRAETNGRGRQLIKYIGSASENFRQRLNKDHRINKEIVNGGRLNVTMYLATMAPECEQAWNFDPRMRGIGVQL